MKLQDILVESTLPAIGKVFIQHINGSSPITQPVWDSIINLLDAKVDPMGQWNHPGSCTMIPTEDGSITMKNVGYAVTGIDETGHCIHMEPEHEYQYPGKNIFEIPHTGLYKTLAMQIKNSKENGKPSWEK